MRILLILLLSLAAHSQPLLLRTGKLFDSRRGELVAGQDILVQGESIAQVGVNLPVPAGARVVDLRGYTVLPGLIDMHTHLLHLSKPGSSFGDDVSEILQEGLPLRALRGAARARTFLLAGITTVRDLGNCGLFGDVALSTAIQEGSVEGPRMWVSGPGLSAEGGQFRGLQPAHRALASEEYRIVRGVEDARVAVRENVAGGANLIKIYSDSLPNTTYLSSAEMRAIVDEAHSMQLKVAAHATSDASALRAVEAGVDSIEHGYALSDRTLQVMKERGTFVVPTNVDQGNLERMHKIHPFEGASPAGIARFQAAQLSRVLASHVKVAAGSDMYLDLNIPQGEAARGVLFSYRDAGMPPSEVLRAATLNAAELLGEKRLGVLEAGAYADIVAVEGNPVEQLEALQRPIFVMKAGKIFRDL